MPLLHTRSDAPRSRPHRISPPPGPPVPESGSRLRILVRIDSDLRSATVEVGGALTVDNCGSLLGVIERTRRLSAGLQVRVELLDPELAEPAALIRLRRDPCSVHGIRPAQAPAAEVPATEVRAAADFPPLPKVRP